jgi:hypothetical protein
MEEVGAVRKPIVVSPEQGRVYAMGRIFPEGFLLQSTGEAETERA